MIIIENYFNDNGDANRLFISADGYLNEVAFIETTDGEMFAQYGPTEQWGKWSPSDDLIYLGRTDIADAAIALPDNGNEVSMLAPLALLGGGGLGAGAAAAAAGVAGVAALGAGGGDTPAAAVTPAVTPATPAVPTVNNPTSTPAVGGPGNAHELVVAGTGVPGDQVVVTIGGETATTTIGGDGTWNAVLNGGNFPSDGVHPQLLLLTTKVADQLTCLVQPLQLIQHLQLLLLPAVRGPTAKSTIPTNFRAEQRLQGLAKLARL